MHAGKLFPLFKSRDFDVGNFWTPRNVPRCGKLINSFTAHGDYAVEWQGLTVISLPVERIDPGPKLRWRFEHPIITGMYLDLISDFHENVVGDPYSNFRWKHTAEFWYGGTKWAFAEAFIQSFPMFNIYPDDFWSADTWSGIVNPAHFLDMGESHIYSAEWDDQPDYHPYRH